jgi:hypothetical protein
VEMQPERVVDVVFDAEAQMPDHVDHLAFVLEAARALCCPVLVGRA